MAVKKESIEIKCPDCKVEFRLWVPATHLTLWEGDDGERVNCVRCPTHFKIRKTLDGIKVFKLQRTIKDVETPEISPPVTPKEETPEATPDDSIVTFDAGDNSEAKKDTPETTEEVKTEKPKEEPEEIATENTEEDITDKTSSDDEPLINIDEDETPEPETKDSAPIIEIEEEVLELNPVKMEEASAMGLTQHGETVLLVEDESLSRAVAENSLIDLNITLLTAVDGEYAIDIIEKNKIDLIVTDLHLSSEENEHPRIDGEHLLQTIADKGLNIPAIITTGKEMIDDIAMNPKWFSLNVKGFVQKGSPFWSEELKDKIKEIINKEG